jgi:hypothetical protein
MNTRLSLAKESATLKKFGNPGQLTEETILKLPDTPL